MPKITFKKAFFRIFWKILAKTGPQSLYLCGFPEARVEMKVALFRALTQSIVCLILNHFKLETKLASPMAYRPTTKRPVNFPLRSESSLVLFCYIPGYVDNKSLSKTEYYIVLFL